MAPNDIDVPAVETLPLPVALRRVTRDVLNTLEWRTPSWLAYWAAVGLCCFLWSLGVLVWAYQIYSGLHITGMLHPIMWGTYITTFVFWIGIAHSGTLISAILFLFRAHWRTTIARAAETMTIVAVMTAGIFPILHLGRSWRFYWLIPYPNERGLWVNFSSPLIWDAIAVGTYFVVSVLFWYLELIPDFAVVRDHSTGWRSSILGWLAIGWRGTAQEWRRFRTAYSLLAGLITALVVSVHSIVSWDFAVAVVPGWHSTIFAPYFVTGAIFSGLAMILTLMIPGRFLLGIREYVTDEHLDHVAKLIVAMSLILTYSYVSELFFASYRGNAFEQSQFIFRATGPYAPLVWLAIVCNSIAPLVFFRRTARRNPTVLFAISIVINLGMWLERFIVIVSSLAHEYDVYSWGRYRPTLFEWTILLGSAGWFLFWFLLLIGHIPSVPMAETKEHLLASAVPETARA
jgi:molybdopterin-containing oxidoreductase family membrane subunit